MTVQAAIAAIQDIMLTIADIREAPDYPPDAMSVYPFAVCFVGSGEFTCMSGEWYKGLHTLTLQLHWPRKDLARDVTKAMAMIDTIMNELTENPKLANTVSTIVYPIRYTFGALSWGGVDTIGFDFKITVKIEATIT